ncbi:MAG: hypothetical protein U1C96_04120 [Gallionella sp.]|nr:hypothetical protein [Gallionella sp.]
MRTRQLLTPATVKQNLIGLAVLAAVSLWPAGVAAQAENAVREPTKQSSQSSLIVPLPPPDSLVPPAAKKNIVIGDFQFDDDQPANSLEVVLRSMFESNHTSGSGRASSFLEPGNYWLHDVEIAARTQLGETWNSELNVALRYTDSRRHDPSNASLQRLQFVASDEKNHVSVGDYYATLSQYSLNRAIKGVGYQRAVGDASHVRVVVGTFDPRWDYLFANKAGEPIDRYVTGVRAQTEGERYRIGLNLVNAWDRDDDPVRTTEDTYRQFLPSVDWEYRTEAGLRLSGEHAYAGTRRQAVNRSETELDGSAHRLNFDGTLGELRLRARAERVSPDFQTLGGGAAIDRLRLYARGDYRLTKVWGVFAAVDRYHDNLGGQLAATTRTQIPEIGISARGLFDRRSLSFSSSLRQRQVDVDGILPQESVSDRIYLSVSDRYNQFGVRGEVEALLNQRKGTTTDSNDDFLYRLSIDSRHQIIDGRFDLRPNLILERQELEDPTTGSMVRTHGVRFDLQLLTQGHLSYGLNLEDRRTNNDILGADDTHLRRIALNLYSKPAILRGGSFRAETGLGDYAFSSAGKDYNERYIRLMLDFPLAYGN